jgi:DNA-binding response OmpR family regulator
MPEKGYVLVVDDEPETLDLVRLTLSTAGFEVEAAESGRDALQLISERNYDLVLLDIMMPELSGYDVLRSLQGRAGLPPIIILTARNQPEDRIIGEKLGATDFLVKPVARGDLLDVIAKNIAAT